MFDYIKYVFALVVYQMLLYENMIEKNFCFYLFKNLNVTCISYKII